MAPDEAGRARGRGANPRGGDRRREPPARGPQVPGSRELGAPRSRRRAVAAPLQRAAAATTPAPSPRGRGERADGRRIPGARSCWRRERRLRRAPLELSRETKGRETPPPWGSSSARSPRPPRGHRPPPPARCAAGCCTTASTLRARRSATVAAGRRRTRCCSARSRRRSDMAPRPRNAGCAAGWTRDGGTGHVSDGRGGAARRPPTPPAPQPSPRCPGPSPAPSAAPPSRSGRAGRSEGPRCRPMRRRRQGTAPPCANGAAAGGERRPGTNAG